MSRQRQSGFTLIELMIVVAIVAIIGAVVYPTYQNSVLRARRADGHEFLQRIAAAQERFYTNRNQYTEELSGATGLSLGSTTSEAGHYGVRAVVPAGGQSYTLTASPEPTQSRDQCANLTVNNVGARGFSGSETNGRCW